MFVVVMILGFWVCFPVWGVFLGLLMVADGGGYRRAFRFRFLAWV
jgi:hypothetical protein